MAIKASSQITLTDVTDAYSVTLTNESYTFVGNTTGTTVGQKCTTQVLAYCGSQQYTNITIISVACPSGIVSTVTDDNTASPTITFQTAAPILDSCEAVITIGAGSLVINKNFSFSVARRGPAGDSGANATYISVKGTNYDATGEDGYAEVYVEGTPKTKLIRSSRRGHTLVVIDPETSEVESVETYDTYSDSTVLEGPLNDVPSGKIICLASCGGTGVSANVRSILNDCGSDDTLTWSGERRTHAFIGMKGLSKGNAYEWTEVGVNADKTVTAYYTPAGIVHNGATGVSITKITRYYILQLSSSEQPLKPDVNPPINWTTTEPSYTPGSDDMLYFTDCVEFSDDTFSFSDVSKSSSYEAAKEAYIKAQEAKEKADELGVRVLNAETSIKENKDAIQLRATKTEITDVKSAVSGKNLAKYTNRGPAGWGWFLNNDATYTVEGVMEDNINTSRLSRHIGDYGIRTSENDDEDSSQSFAITDATYLADGYDIEVVQNESGTQTLNITVAKPVLSTKSYMYFRNVDRIRIEPGTMYTVSFEYKSNVKQTFTIGFYGVTIDGNDATLVDGYNEEDTKENSYTTTGTWTKYTAKFKPTNKVLEPSDWYLFINGLDSTPGAYHQFKNLQLEAGEEATEWMPGASIKYDLVGKEEFTAYQKRAESSLNVMADKIQMSISNTRTELKEDNDNLMALYKELRMNYDFTADGQYIGRKDSDTMLRLVNDMMQILIAGTAVTTLDTSGLTATEANITTLHIGDYTLAYGVDGHLRLT